MFLVFCNVRVVVLCWNSLWVFAVRRLKPSITVIAADCSRLTSVNQHHASNACRRPAWPHSENRTLTGSDETKPRCSDSLYAPAWPSCVCCLWWVSNQRIEKHGSLWMLRDTIFVFMTRYLNNSFLLPHNATCLEFIYFKVFKMNYTKFTLRCFKIFIGFSFNLNNLLTYCGLF